MREPKSAVTSQSLRSDDEATLNRDEHLNSRWSPSLWTMDQHWRTEEPELRRRPSWSRRSKAPTTELNNSMTTMIPSAKLNFKSIVQDTMVPVRGGETQPQQTGATTISVVQPAASQQGFHEPWKLLRHGRLQNFHSVNLKMGLNFEVESAQHRIDRGIALHAEVKCAYKCININMPSSNASYSTNSTFEIRLLDS